MKKKGNEKLARIFRAAAALAGAAVFFLMYPTLGPVAESVLGQATIFSAALTMPEGAALTLQERFAGEIVPLEEADPLPSVPPASSASEPQDSSSSQQDPSNQEPSPSTPSAGDYDPNDIPQEYRAALLEETVTGEEGNEAFVRWENAWIRNYTNLSGQEILDVLKTPSALKMGDSGQPQVLLYHTHTTESYDPSPGEFYDTRNNWRDVEKTNNMAAVGEALAQELEALGINVIHDTTLHDYPSYNGAYDRSKVTVEEYLERYPSIRIAIDIHRDAVIYDDLSVLKPVVEVDGRKAAQLMIIAPCDDAGSVGVPRWQENFRFAARLASDMEEAYPGLTRPIFFCYRHYNLDLTDGSLLFEFGTNGNTLEESLYTARLIAPILADYINGAVS